MPELDALEILLRLAVAAVLGGAIGLEREIREREAGLRTHMLVALGAALFTLVSAYAWSDWAFSTEAGLVFDPTRIAAQVVSGIGFLGAGAIIRQGFSIRGLTTAATLWVVAAIGMAAGTGYLLAATLTAALVLVSLWPLRLVAFRLFGRLRPADGRILLELARERPLGDLVRTLEARGAQVATLEVDEREADRRTVVVHARFSDAEAGPALAARLGDEEGILSVRWSR